MKNQKQILFEESAVRETLKELRSMGYTFRNIHYTNKRRYCIVIGDPNIAILLKTEPFFNFGVMFGKIGEKGVGDSINCESLKEFIRCDVKVIYTKFRDGKLYYITLKDFLNNSYRWVQKEGTAVRSISIHHYVRVNI